MTVSALMSALTCNMFTITADRRERMVGTRLGWRESSLRRSRGWTERRSLIALFSHWYKNGQWIWVQLTSRSCSLHSSAFLYIPCSVKTFPSASIVVTVRFSQKVTVSHATRKLRYTNPSYPCLNTHSVKSAPPLSSSDSLNSLPAIYRHQRTASISSWSSKENSLPR